MRLLSIAPGDIVHLITDATLLVAKLPSDDISGSFAYQSEFEQLA